MTLKEVRKPEKQRRTLLGRPKAQTEQSRQLLEHTPHRHEQGYFPFVAVILLYQGGRVSDAPLREHTSKSGRNAENVQSFREAAKEPLRP